MDVKLAPAGSTGSTFATDALIVIAAEGVRHPALEKPAASAWESGEITGKFLDFTLLHNVAGLQAARVLVAGSGKPGKLTVSNMAKLSGAAVRFLKGKGVRKAALLLEGDLATA